MAKNKKRECWFGEKSLNDMTEKERKLQGKREELYQLAVHYAIKKEGKTISVSSIQGLYVPLDEGWRMTAGYPAFQEILERMVEEKIVKKVPRKVGTKLNGNEEKMTTIYRYEVIRKRAPFALSKELQKVLKNIQKQDEKKLEPGKRLHAAILTWIKEETGQEKLQSPFDLRFVSNEYDSYTYQLFNQNELLSQKTFHVKQLMKQKKTA